MNAAMTIKVAGRALVRNKTRSSLTALGVIIGVAAVIAMVAIGEGAKAQVAAQFEALGSNLLIVLPGGANTGGARGGFGSQPTLTWDDLAAIQRELPEVRDAAAILRSQAQIQSEESNWSTSVAGTSPDYFELRQWPVARGVPLAAADVEGGAKVVLLGKTVVGKLFGPGAEPVGQIVRIKGIPFQVIGVLTGKGQSPGGMDFDDAVYVPQTTFVARIQGGLPNYIAGIVMVRAVSREALPAAQAAIGDLLRDRHHLAATADDDFSIRNLTDQATAQAEGTETMTTLLFWIAAVSLLVGGIGIMNIMLVSVTERTREIGLRMAVGARPRDILGQFLVEALTLSLAGGLLGVALGVGAAKLLALRFSWPTLVRPEIVALAAGFSGVVGVVFGLYPAHKASRLDPIEALRHE